MNPLYNNNPLNNYNPLYKGLQIKVPSLVKIGGIATAGVASAIAGTAKIINTQLKKILTTPIKMPSNPLFDSPELKLSPFNWERRIAQELEERRRKLCEDYGILQKQEVTSGSVNIPSEGTGKGVYAKVSTDTNRLSPAEQVANAEYIYDYLSQKGWSKEAICGLLGNIQQESWFNPGVWQNLNDTTLGYGLVQWDDATKFLNWAGLDKNSTNEMAKNDSKHLMELEVDFQMYSMQPGQGEWLPSLSANYGSPYQMKYSEFITSTKNAGDLALVFHGSYERSSDDAIRKQNRIDFANNWYNKIGNTNAAIEWLTSIQ